MLRLGAEASTADLNGRGAPDGPLEEWERRCRAGVTDPDGRFRQEIGFLMLFRDGPKGYLPLGSPLDGPQSGECRVISTSTPPGVGLGQKPPLYLKPGQTMRLGITGLGEQRQTTVAA